MDLKSENKSKEELADKIIQECKELKSMLEEGKLKEKLFEYELIKLNSKTPMLDEQTRKLMGITLDYDKYNILDTQSKCSIGITSQEFMQITENYDKLIKIFPDVKELAVKKLQCIKSANRAKIIVIKGCEKCIEIVSKKLDVDINDLCYECKKIVELQG